MTVTPINMFLAILIGAAASVLSGMFGIGGATATTPSLRLFLHSTPQIALGTTLPVAIPTAIVGGYTYGRRGLVDWYAASYVCLGGIFGAVGGAMLTHWLNLHYLMILTGLIILYVAINTIVRGARGKEAAPVDGEAPPGEPEDGEESRRGSRPGALLVLAIGLVTGFYSGLLGVGGGVVMVPAFFYLLKMPLKKAIGTSLIGIAVIAIPGTIVHALLGHISGLLFLFLIIGVIPGAYLGARITIKAGERLTFILFGCALASFGVVFIVSEIIELVR